MAGDYIMLDHDLPDKPEVSAIFEATGVEIATICGRMFILWKLADRLTEDGIMRGMGINSLCAKCGGDKSFWEAVAAAGWIELRENAVAIPRFKKRFGKSARERMLASRRKQEQRCKDSECHDEAGHDRDNSVTTSVQTPNPEPEPEPVSVPELKTGTGRAGVFVDVTVEILKDSEMLLDWHKRASSKKKPIVTGSERDVLRTFCAAERAIECGDNPVGLFASIFRDRLWEHITGAQEDRAAARLKAHRATGPPVDAEYRNLIQNACKIQPTE